MIFFVADAKLHVFLRQYWMHVPMTIVPAQLFAALRRLKSLSRLRSQTGRGARGLLDADVPASEESDPTPNDFVSPPC